MTRVLFLLAVVVATAELWGQKSLPGVAATTELWGHRSLPRDVATAELRGHSSLPFDVATAESRGQSSLPGAVAMTEDNSLLGDVATTELWGHSSLPGDVAMTESGGHSSLPKEAVYPEFEKDRLAMRQTVRVGEHQGSSGTAIEAARRFFRQVKLVGLSRQRILELLGDPKTVSDYGVAAPAAPEGPLTYRFDSGFGGWEYVIEFRDGRVSAVRERGLD